MTLLFVLFVAFVVYTLHSTGYFRTIAPYMQGEIAQQIDLVGAEDMTISKDGNFMLISSDDRAATKKGRPKQGGIYWMDLKKEPFEVKLISGDFKQEFHPHGISLLQLDSTHYKLWVINHVEDKHSIEVFSLEGDSLKYLETLKDDKMVSPNDIVAVEEDRFYFTNDHFYKPMLGKLAEGYLGMATANVMYFNGKEFMEVAKGMAYANGINWDKNRDLLFVASTRDFLVKVYEVEADGNLIFVENINCNTGVDNIEIDTNGGLWIGAHPSLMAYTAYANFEENKAPSEVLKITYASKNKYIIEKPLLDDGLKSSGSSVAATDGKFLFVGTVMDKHFLIIKRENEKY
ncbi:MAG: SMP-30/gluconolactonase/LRE family protein [Chitinophagales bacterium]